MSEPIVAGVELGGTKAIAVVGAGNRIFDRAVIPTTSPDETLGALAEQLRRWQAEHRPRALGIASFGPIDLNRASATFGHMLATPKAGWAGADVAGALSAAIDGPMMLHTDVTAAALAEGRWGGAVGLSDIIYITIGTGIGMGIVSGGRPVAGRMHPEAGHLRVRRLAGDDFPGTCPFHGDCLEGLAAGPAIGVRFDGKALQAAPDDPRWAPIVDALAEGLAALTLALSPQRILIGGGVGVGQAHLLPRVRTAMAEKLGGYLPGFDDDETLADYLAVAALGGEAGPLGALALGAMALEGE